ncbi:DNA cytosine methyltransferase (plasmid) [Rossellomorea sp. AcN35-11]|nr:DNA cytosine methyltransferase [Rossellomorea aquimaris]WJV31688.1 DNA cytosine methyltransferase [Rossellomorea sp. AcN35-11]
MKFNSKKRPYKIKNRLYIEAKYLEKFGFGIGQAIKYIYDETKQEIKVVPVSESSKHVAQTTQKTGNVVPVIDIRGGEIESFFAKHKKVQVEIVEGKIVFTVLEQVNENIISLEEKKKQREIKYSISVPELAKVVNGDQMSIVDMFRVSKSDVESEDGLGKRLKDKAIKMLSLFSGCGSMDKGFLDEGYDIVFANDRYEEKALKDYHIQTYKENIGDHIVMKDVMELKEEDIPEVSFLAAGIPCVKFSPLNTKNNYRDSDSDTDPLVEKTIDIIKWSKTKAFLFENVRNFITAKKGAILKRLKEALPTFNIIAKAIKATELGSAQGRTRFFVFGIQNAEPEMTLPHLAPYTTIKDAFANVEKAPQQDIRFTPTNKTLERMSYVPEGGNIKDVPVELRAPNKKFSNYCQRLKYKGQAPTITHVQDDVIFIVPDPEIHPVECKLQEGEPKPRYISVREAARLFSLPDDFTFKGNRTAIFEMLKNAVDYKVSRFLAKTIKSQLLNVLEKPIMS